MSKRETRLLLNKMFEDKKTFKPSQSEERELYKKMSELTPEIPDNVLTNISFKFPKALKDDLQTVSNLTGQTMTDIVTNLLNKEFTHYRNANGSGRVKPVPAYRLTGISEYEQRLAKLEGLPFSEGKHKCFVLDDVTVNPRQPYYKIYDCESKQIRTIAKEFISFN